MTSTTGSSSWGVSSTQRCWSETRPALKPLLTCAARVSRPAVALAPPCSWLCSGVSTRESERTPCSRQLPRRWCVRACDRVRPSSPYARACLTRSIMLRVGGGCRWKGSARPCSIRLCKTFWAQRRRQRSPSCPRPRLLRATVPRTRTPSWNDPQRGDAHTLLEAVVHTSFRQPAPRRLRASSTCHSY